MRDAENRAWPVPFFSGGRPCLDFVNTVNSRVQPATKDYLADSAALLGWCRQMALFDAPILGHLEQLAGDDPETAAAVHRRAIALREALHRIFRNLIDGRPVPGMDMIFLNEAIRAARGHQVLESVRDGFAWHWNAAWLDLFAPVHAVAISAGDLLSGEDLRRLKACPGPEGCGWLFFDETKNVSRRWCSMEHCGSAAKTRRYAARHGIKPREVS